MRLSEIFIQRIYRTGFLLVVFLILADLLTFFYYPNTVAGDIFLATREQTPLTWISSVAFLFIALSCLSAYLETNKKLWYFLAATFFFFSMDDATYFHERISGFLVDNTSTLGVFPTYAWVIVYFPLLAFSLGSFIYLLWKDTNKKTKKMALVALFLLGLAIAFDLTDGFFKKNPNLVFCLSSYCNTAATHLLRLSEEVLEVIALGMLGYVNIKNHCLAKNKGNDKMRHT